MNRRILSVLLLLALVLTMVPVSVLAAPAGIPIYLGYIEVDYMAEEILKTIPTAGKSAEDQIQAVYDWIIDNCGRSDWDGAAYFDEEEVSAKSQGSFADACAEKVANGEILVRRELEEDAGYSSAGDFYISYDSNYYIATFAYEMMMTHTGDCAHYSALLATLLSHLGYDCRLIAGSFLNNDGSAVEHKWNYVLVDGKYYWLDVRMDHATGGHTYFMKTDTAAWATDHQWDPVYTDWLDENADAIAADYGSGSNSDEGPWDKCSGWAEAYMERAGEAGLIPERLEYTDLTQNITRAEFAAVAVLMYEALERSVPEYKGESPFSDTRDPDVLRAYSLGIVNGMGDGTFAPDANLTREQAVTMLGRVYELAQTNAISGGAALEQNTTHFIDHSSIFDYAKSYVYFFSGQGIVEGMGDGTFAPKLSMTREQALKIAVETVDKLR